MHAVVGVAVAVQVDVPLVLGELLLVLLLEFDRIGRLGKELLEEVDVLGGAPGGTPTGGWLMMRTPPSRTSGLPRYMLKK